MAMNMQLDLFADSRDVLLRNDAISALRARDQPAAIKAHAKLLAEYPNDRFLAPIERLLEALATPTDRLTHVQIASIASKRMEMQAAAAHQLFGAGHAQEWLMPLWRSLAERVAGLPFCAEMPSAHAAPMLLKAGEWVAVDQAVASIPAWRRMPQTLAWMAEARHAHSGLAAAWPLLIELAWRAPTRFSELARRLNAPALEKLLHHFETEFLTAGDAELAWFPAWALVVEPSLAKVLRQVDTTRGDAPERTFQIVMQLLDLERQGRHADLIDNRKRLRDLHPELFAFYMSSR